MKISKSIILIIVSTMHLFGQEYRTIKGIIVDDKNEVLIGATIAEYGNIVNYVLSDLDGKFEIIVLESDKTILKITYGCSLFYEVLYEMKLEDEYVKVESYTRKTDRNTKKIRRKLKRWKLI